MPNGKLAGERCIQLDDDQCCKIFGHPDRPAVCGSLQPSHEMCGETRFDALQYLTKLETLTAT